MDKRFLGVHGAMNPPEVVPRGQAGVGFGREGNWGRILVQPPVEVKDE